jgi:hypothetical protein
VQIAVVIKETSWFVIAEIIHVNARLITIAVRTDAIRCKRRNLKGPAATYVEQPRDGLLVASRIPGDKLGHQTPRRSAR